MDELDTYGYYALGIPLLGLLLLLELALSRRPGAARFAFAETLSNLACGLGTLLIGLFSGGSVLALYEWSYRHYALFSWHGSRWRWPAALLIADLAYYLHHRAGHRFGLLWAIHGIHHQHEQQNSSVGFRLEWLADLSTLFFFALLPLAGIDPTCGFLVIALLSLYALSTHSPTLSRPSFGFLVTPQSHGAHHSRDSRFSDRNYAAMFLLWDQLLGTYRRPPTELGSDQPSICRLYDGVGAQASLLRELVDQMRRAPNVTAALRLLVERPQLTAGTYLPSLRQDRELDAPSRRYLLFDFLSTAALTTWLLWLAGTTPLPLRIAAALLLIWGLRTNGRLLDGRPGAWGEQRRRLWATLLLGLLPPWSPLALRYSGVAALLVVLNLLWLRSLRSGSQPV
jgi:sterol desaturase/sphingolipid hydroxylase (fatty acid hydroxylase superfamily)